MNSVSTPTVSIVVASLNCERTIGKCLESIFELNYPRELLEVILVDGLSRDRTVKIAEKYPVKIVALPLNAPAAYNYAMKIVKGELFGLVDADAKVEKEWLNKLVVHLGDPKVAGVSGNIETWNSENVWARIIGYELKNRYSRIGKYAPRIATMNLLLKKSVIEAVGGFDESLPAQYDTDLGYRLTNLGFKIAFEPAAKCYHFNRSTVQSYFRQQQQYGKNTLKLYFKHASLARGDEITDFWMNIQPALGLGIVVFFLLGLINVLRPLWYVSFLILVFDFVYFVYSAAKISVKFHDFAALLLVVLYVVRAVAWASGAAITAINQLTRERR